MSEPPKLPDASEGASRRPSLDETKPPREWRSARAPSSAPAPAPTPTPAPMPVASSEVPLPSGLPTSRDRAETSTGLPRGAAPTPQVHVPDMGPPLPQQYGADRLVLLVRDPHWSYAWWELTEPALDSARQSLQERGQLVLRFYDVSAIEWNGNNHHSSFDIELQEQAGNWYVEIARPGADFVAEVGLRGRDGRFIPLARSNVVAMPRDSMSPITDENWMIVEEEYRRMFELSGGRSIGLGSGEILRALEERQRRELSVGGVSSFGISSLASRREV